MGGGARCGARGRRRGGSHRRWGAGVGQLPVFGAGLGGVGRGEDAQREKGR
jgi:hypothetical protein